MIFPEKQRPLCQVYSTLPIYLPPPLPLPHPALSSLCLKFQHSQLARDRAATKAEQHLAHWVLELSRHHGTVCGLDRYVDKGRRVGWASASPEKWSCAGRSSMLLSSKNLEGSRELGRSWLASHWLLFLQPPFSVPKSLWCKTRLSSKKDKWLSPFWPRNPESVSPCPGCPFWPYQETSVLPPIPCYLVVLQKADLHVLANFPAGEVRLG